MKTMARYYFADWPDAGVPGLLGAAAGRPVVHLSGHVLPDVRVQSTQKQNKELIINKIIG